MPIERPRECSNLLLVEGVKDFQTISTLMKENGIIWDSDPVRAPVWIEQYNGHTNLLRKEVISVELKTRGLKALGIITDADESLTQRWQKIREVCLPSVVDIPETISDAGLIHTTMEGIRFGVWIMPDNQSPGMLETFLAYLLPSEDETLWTYSEEVVMEAKRQGASFIDKHLDKAKIHTWLAWQNPPGKSFREALQKKILDSTHPRSQSFVTWFRSLYTL